MKKWVLVLVGFSCFGSVNKLFAQSQEVQQLLLNVEKLVQLRNILSDMKKGYAMASGGYETIKNISQGNFALHKAFLDGLLEVSPVVKNYSRVAGIISTQARLVIDCKRGCWQLRESGKFTAFEMDYLEKVYANIFDRSRANIGALAKVITPGQLRMSDNERLSTIDAIWTEIEDSYTFLKHFTNKAKVIALQRTKEQNSVDLLRKLYPIKH